MKKPVVFSLVREQSMFMTAIMSLLTFLSVLALGIALSIGTGVMRWNAQWENFATVQVTNPDNINKAKKIITDNTDKIKTLNEISTDQMNELMSPWISGGGVLKNYLPKMWEIEFNTTADLKSVGEQISKHARFLTHATALKSSTGAGWKMILMSSFITFSISKLKFFKPYLFQSLCNFIFECLLLLKSSICFIHLCSKS